MNIRVSLHINHYYTVVSEIRTIRVTVLSHANEYLFFENSSSIINTPKHL